MKIPGNKVSIESIARCSKVEKKVKRGGSERVWLIPILESHGIESKKREKENGLLLRFF